MATDDATLRVVVSFSAAARQVDEVSVALPAGATLADALRSSKLPDRHPSVASMLAGSISEGLQVGVWGKIRPLDHLLRDGDRVEIYRGLQVDPMDARRRRHQGHKAALRD